MKYRSCRNVKSVCLSVPHLSQGQFTNLFSEFDESVYLESLNRFVIKYSFGHFHIISIDILL
jgi:hypothetical protein